LRIRSDFADSLPIFFLRCYSSHVVGYRARVLSARATPPPTGRRRRSRRVGWFVRSPRSSRYRSKHSRGPDADPRKLARLVSASRVSVRVRLAPSVCVDVFRRGWGLRGIRPRHVSQLRLLPGDLPQRVVRGWPHRLHVHDGESTRPGELRIYGLRIVVRLGVQPELQQRGDVAAGASIVLSKGLQHDAHAVRQPAVFHGQTLRNNRVLGRVRVQRKLSRAEQRVRGMPRGRHKLRRGRPQGVGYALRL
jgi:hypothetical protein